MKTLILVLLLLGAWYHFYYIETLPNTHSDATVDMGPFQHTITPPKKFEFKGVTLVEKANFSLTAKVLSAERYYFDRHSSLSSMDIVVGWFNLSNDTILNDIKFLQSDRGYQWQSNSEIVTNQEILRTTSNIHLIPATDEIAQQLKQIKIGQVIYLEGRLVDVENPSGWNWKTSLSQTDTGKNSSEILYLTELNIIE